MLLLLSANLVAKYNPYVSNYKEIFTLNKIDGGFYRSVEARGAFKENTYTENIYFGELEKIQSVQAFQRNKQGKIKKISKDKIYKSDLFSNSFYDGYKAQKIDFSKNNTEDDIQYFEYKSIIYNKELMCLTQLIFLQMEDVIIDTIQYTLHIPNTHKLILNYKDLLTSDSIRIDSAVTNDEIIYNFTKYNFNNKFSYELDKEPKIKNKFKGIRFIIVPKNENPYLYFNQWYQTLIEKIPPSTNFRIICDSLSKSVANKDSLIKSIYRYVTHKIKYIDIENGINAFIPRKSDDILLAQQGDCKDMAFLLYNMLTYLGFDAHIALSSTLSHEHELDFPSLSSANHSICILDYNSKRYYLDATEYNGIYNIPSRQIQNTKAFISKNKSFEIIEIPAQPVDFNSSTFTYNLKVNGSKTQGDFKNIYNGYAKLSIEDITKKYSKSKSQQIIGKYLQGKKFNLIYNNIIYKDLNTQLLIGGEIALSSNNLTKVDNKYYLSLSFLPYVHPFEIEADTSENLLFYTTTKNSYKINIELEDIITKISSPYKNYKIKENGIEYEFKISNTKNNLIIEYSYTNPYVKLSPKEVPTFNQINQFINSTLNHEIIIN